MKTFYYIYKSKDIYVQDVWIARYARCPSLNSFLQSINEWDNIDSRIMYRYIPHQCALKLIHPSFMHDVKMGYALKVNIPWPAK